MRETFEKYLENVCFEDNPMVLDDDMSDFFDNWLSNLDVQEVMDYAQKWGEEIIETKNN